MTGRVRGILATVAVWLVGAAAVAGSYPAGQAVTYSNFSYIKGIAASVERVYFLTTEGITVYNRIAELWEEPVPPIPGEDADDIDRIWTDQFGVKLYAETFTGMYVFDAALEAWFPTSEEPEGNPVTSRVPPPPIMHAPAGYNYMGDGELIDQQGRNWAVSEVLDDGSGTYWMGIWGYGAAEASTSNLIIEPLPFGLLQRRVNALELEKNGYLWASGGVYEDTRSGITGFDPDGLKFHYIESGLGPEFPSVDINCLAVDSKYIYAGTPLGLYYIDRETESVAQLIDSRDGLLDENVLSVAVTGDSVYIGTDEGLSLAVGGTDSLGWVFPTTFSGQRVWDIEAVNGQIWVASSTGAFRIKPESAQLQKFTDRESVLFGEVYDIERSGNRLWFVSEAGLVELNLETAETRSFQEVSAKVSPRVLAVNEKIAAVSSDKGLTIFFHADPSKPFKRDFTTADGLASNNVFSLVMDGDYLWVGTDKGLTRFLWNNPDRVD